MLIAMNGRLDKVFASSESEFDSYITRNFDTVLNLALKSNSNLQCPKVQSDNSYF